MPCHHPMMRFSPPFASDDEAKELEGQYFYLTSIDGSFEKDCRIHNGAALISIPNGEAPDVFADRFDSVYRQVPIPCGKCDSCRLRARREMTYRLVKEAELYSPDQVLFLTLTYDDDHLHFGRMVLPFDVREDGSLEVVEAASLRKEDLSTFKKDLRAYLDYHFPGVSVRTYECGEYGPQTNRPHYHMILYGLPVDLLSVPPHRTAVWSRKEDLHESSLFNEIWKRGRVLYSLASFDTMQYVAGYVLKKALGRQSDLENELFYLAEGEDPQLYEFRSTMKIARHPAQREAPFTNGSRRPGLGRGWYEAHVDELYSLDEMFIKHGDRVERVKPASYFDRLYDVDHHEDLTRLKLQRRSDAKNKQKTLVHQSKLNEQQLYEKQIASERARSSRIKRDRV